MGKVKKGIAAFLVGAAGLFGVHQALPSAEGGREHVVPETAMIDLTEQLGSYARERHPGFLLVGNGPVGLLEATKDNSEENVARLVRALDGILMESRFYDGYEEDGDTPERNDGDLDEYLTAMLRKPLMAGKAVFTLDYVKGKRIHEVEELGAEQGYVAEAGDRLLDVIPKNPPLNENADDVTQLKQVKNFLFLLPAESRAFPYARRLYQRPRSDELRPPRRRSLLRRPSADTGRDGAAEGEGERRQAPPALLHERWGGGGLPSLLEGRVEHGASALARRAESRMAGQLQGTLLVEGVARHPLWQPRCLSGHDYGGGF